jgi:hypothetical protein
LSPWYRRGICAADVYRACGGCSGAGDLQRHYSGDDELGAAQRFPTRATVIYTGEPVWAGVFGRIAGERLPLLALVGAAFIVAGVLVSELKLKKRRKAIAGLGAEQGADS